MILNPLRLKSSPITMEAAKLATTGEPRLQQCYSKARHFCKLREDGQSVYPKEPTGTRSISYLIVGASGGHRIRTVHGVK